MGHRLLPYRPELYHGRESSRPYFEGWYFKQSCEGKAFSVIPGIFRGSDESTDVAFIQIILTDPQRSFFVEYPPGAFRCEKDRFAVWVGNSFFSFEKVVLDIEQIGLSAKLDYSGITPLETSFFSPSIMGPFSYLPSMQCNHGVLSLRHEVNGSLSFRGEKTEFNNADGYIEKDWGEAFPESWVWMQCCDKDSAFMCSAAVIPYGPFKFMGLISVLQIGGKQYRFATYNQAKLFSFKIRDGKVYAEIKRGNLLLITEAENSGFINLKAPTNTGMDRDIKESICARIKLTLCEGGSEIYSGSFENGGLEMSDAGTLFRPQ